MTTTTSSNHSTCALSSDTTDAASTADARQRLAYRTSWRDPVTYLPLATLAVFGLAWVGTLLAEPRQPGDAVPAAQSDAMAMAPKSDRLHVYWPSDAGEALSPVP